MGNFLNGTTGVMDHHSVLYSRLCCYFNIDFFLKNLIKFCSTETENISCFIN